MSLCVCAVVVVNYIYPAPFDPNGAWQLLGYGRAPVPTSNRLQSHAASCCPWGYPHHPLVTSQSSPLSSPSVGLLVVVVEGMPTDFGEIITHATVSGEHGFVLVFASFLFSLFDFLLFRFLCLFPVRPRSFLPFVFRDLSPIPSRASVLPNFTARLSPCLLVSVSVCFLPFSR